jgi:hypothetical protein
MGLKESPDDLACTFAATYQQLHPQADRTMQSATPRPETDGAQLPDRDERRA